MPELTPGARKAADPRARRATGRTRPRTSPCRVGSAGSWPLRPLSRAAIRIQASCSWSKYRFAKISVDRGPSRVVPPVIQFPADVGLVMQSARRTAHAVADFIRGAGLVTLGRRLCFGSVTGGGGKSFLILRRLRVCDTSDDCDAFFPSLPLPLPSPSFILFPNI